MIREHFIDHAKMNKDVVRWRGHEISRIEAFSDAVFAFAITLLIVSLEVPKDFDELVDNTATFLGFGLGFMLMFQVWYTQNTFFRRFGMHDFWTICLNGMLLFTVLFFVYPLKFLISYIRLYPAHHVEHSTPSIRIDQGPVLMTIYGAGFLMIFLLFTLMHLNVLKQKLHLHLNAIELFETRTQIYRNLVFVSTAAISMILAWTLPTNLSGLSGIFYASLGISLTVLIGRRKKLERKIFGKINHDPDSDSPAQAEA